MEQKKYSIILSRRADIMLLKHTEFLAQVSPAAARRLLKEFQSATGFLVSNPFQYPFADSLDAPGIPLATYRKCLFEGRYKALFLIEEDDVYIDAIIDCRQENKKLY